MVVAARPGYHGDKGGAGIQVGGGVEELEAEVEG